jgi:hypothetical protein
MSCKLIVFKVSPELNDGYGYGILPNKQALLDTVAAWADGELDEHPSSCSIASIEMTQEEFDNLPEC